MNFTDENALTSGGLVVSYDFLYRPPGLKRGEKGCVAFDALDVPELRYSWQRLFVALILTISASLYVMYTFISYWNDYGGIHGGSLLIFGGFACMALSALLNSFGKNWYVLVKDKSRGCEISTEHGNTFAKACKVKDAMVLRFAEVRRGGR